MAYDLLHVSLGVGLIAVGIALVHKLPEIVHQFRLWLPLREVSDFLDRRARRRRGAKSPDLTADLDDYASGRKPSRR